MTFRAIALLCVLTALTGCRTPRDHSQPIPPPESNPFATLAPDSVPMHELDAPLELVEDEAIVFPENLRKKNKEGVVYLLVAVNPEGRVIACQIEDADHDDIAEFVRSDIARRRFTEPKKDGHPVEAYGRLPVPYRIGSGALIKLIRKTDWEPSARK